MEPFKPGKTISFRLPADTPLSVSTYLSERKEELGRKFSSDMAHIFVSALSHKILNNEDQKQLSIPLPDGLTLEQENWLKSPHTKSLISQMLYQIITKPGVPYEILSEPTRPPSAPEPEKVSFQTNDMIQSFAKKTFLDFDDDDD